MTSSAWTYWWDFLSLLLRELGHQGGTPSPGPTGGTGKDVKTPLGACIVLCLCMPVIVIPEETEDSPSLAGA